MCRRFSARVTLATVVMTLGLAGTTFAKTDPAVACAASKLKTTGATASAILACHAGAAQKGLATDPECVDAASAKLAAAFVKAEEAARKAGSRCPSLDDAAGTQGEVDAFVASVVAALRPQLGGSKCAAKKLASVGKHAQKLLGAHAANRIKADPGKFADKVAAAEAFLTKLFAKLAEKGKDCQTSGDGPDMIAAVESLIVKQICDDTDRCTTDSIAGLVCQHAPITCSPHHACDFTSGSCAPTDCCLMGVGTAFCVVEIPIAQIPTSQSFCQNVVAGHPSLKLLNFGDDCIGWRATGADDCF
jgi:hypothetical protein